jgi:hypothetical protein
MLRTPFLHAALGAALCLGAAPALAFSEVYAYANATAGCAQDSYQEYQDTAPFSDALVLASASGAFDGICSGFNYPGYTGFAGSVASASLRRGELSAYALASGGPIAGASIRLSVAVGGGRLRDTVTILGPTASFSTTVRVGLRVDGNLAGMSASFGSLVIGGVQRIGCFSTDQSATTCSSYVAPGPFAYDVFFDVPVSSTSPSFLFTMNLNASAVEDGEADASSTAALYLQLPAGYSFTSDSGLLLVAEPSVLALFGAGLAGTAIARRRRAG